MTTLRSVFVGAHDGQLAAALQLCHNRQANSVADRWQGKDAGSGCSMSFRSYRVHKSQFMHLAIIATLWTCLAVPTTQAEWMDVVNISNTLGNTGGSVCIGAGGPDIGCPAYAPQVGVDGTVSATRFVGNGSSLTGVVAETTDRIVSATTSMVALQNTSYINLTQNGSNTGWFDPTSGLVTLGVSSTGRVSATSMYSANNISTGSLSVRDGPLIIGGANSTFTLSLRTVGNRQLNMVIRNSGGAYLEHNDGSLMLFGGPVWTGEYVTIDKGLGLTVNGRARVANTLYVGGSSAAPSATLAISGTTLISSWTSIGFDDSSRTATAALEVSGTVSATSFVGDGSGLTGVAASRADRIVSGTTSMLAMQDTGYVSLTQAGSNSAWFDPTRGLVTLGVSSTGPVSGTQGYFTGPVGIASPTPPPRWKSRALYPPPRSASAAVQ